MPANTISVEVLIDIDFEDANLSPADLANTLRRNVEAAVGRGLLTDGQDGYVESHDVSVCGSSLEEKSLDQEDLANWLSRQIEDGHIHLEEIPRLMARYAFSSPASMRQEFAERMKI